MKVATTVFVGNISEKASDTLIRQILLVSVVNMLLYCVVMCGGVLLVAIAMWTD